MNGTLLVKNIKHLVTCDAEDRVFTVKVTFFDIE